MTPPNGAMSGLFQALATGEHGGVMGPLLKIASIAAIVVAFEAPATAQIICTSLPKALPGKERDRFSAHVMVTPVARWDYKEVYQDSAVSSDLAFSERGAISATPNSTFMAAGEVALALGSGNWSLTAGGWYNKLGSHDFALSSYTAAATADFLLAAPMTAKVRLDIDMYEGHLGIFYKSFGIQAGYVRTAPKTTFEQLDVVWGGIDLGQDTSQGASGVPTTPRFLALSATNDWSVHGVFRKSAPRWGLSAGLGAYVMQGIKTSAESPLRFPSDQTVLSAFVTGSVTLLGPVGIDLSFWYLGNTGTYSDYRDAVEALPTKCVLSGHDCTSLLAANPAKLPSGINKSRLTIGVGFSF